MIRKTQAILIIITSLGLLGCVSEENTPLPTTCINNKDAIQIAISSFIPIYGKDKILSEQPFKATSKDEKTWLVEGSISFGFVGGAAYAEIQKEDCKVLIISHGK